MLVDSEALGTGRELSEDERMLRDAARAFAQDRLQPRVIKAFAEEAGEDGAKLLELVNQIGK